ncbi:MAG: hypothetical protein KAS94_14585, partial [Desulfobulbaceae bacterium]|nr:hypothetical protein [Desulfobulbaceae bacterium]
EFKGYASNRAEGAGRGTTTAALGMLAGGAQSGNPLGMALAIILTPPAMIIGGVTGTVVAEPSHKVYFSEKEIKESIEKLELNYKISSHFIAFSEEITKGRGANRFTRINDMSPQSHPANRGLEDLPDYTYLAEKDIDTVLELSVLGFGLIDGKLDINPPLAFYMNFEYRVVSTKDNKELMKRPVTYTSGKRRLTEWADDNAETFETTMNVAIESIAEKVAEDIFIVRNVGPFIFTPQVPKPPRPYKEEDQEDDMGL